MGLASFICWKQHQFNALNMIRLDSLYHTVPQYKTLVFFLSRFSNWQKSIIGMENFNSRDCLLQAVSLSCPIPPLGWPMNSCRVGVNHTKVFPTKTRQQFMPLCATIRDTSPTLSCKLKMMVKHCCTCPCDPWCSAALTRPSGRCQTPARLSASPAPLPRR